MKMKLDKFLFNCTSADRAWETCNGGGNIPKDIYAYIEA